MIIKITIPPTLAPAIIAIGRPASGALVGGVAGVLVGLTWVLVALTTYIMNVVSSTIP